MTTSLRAAIQGLLGDEPLEGFVRSRRDSGESWRAVSVALYDATGISVAHESLRAWYPDETAEVAS
jgi:hypothetical protein